MQSKNGGGGCEQGSSSAYSNCQRSSKSEKRGSPTLLQGLDQSASAWMAGEPLCPSKEVRKTREEMMNTYKQGKINPSIAASCSAT